MLLMELMAQGLQSEHSQQQRDLIYQLYRTAQDERASAEAEISILRSNLAAAEEKNKTLLEASQRNLYVKREGST